MKKIILSAAVAAMAFSTSAVAADKGIDIDVTGQATLYYETHSGNGTNDKGYASQASSTASAGIQLNLGSDLGNNFTFGSQITYLGSLGLGKDIVSATKQTAGTEGNTRDELALTKIFIAKQIANTTLKMGRQELPKSLSPLAFTEGWNVYKNTFDAILAVNTDLPKTTLVGAYVTGGTGMSLGTTGDLVGKTTAGTTGVNGAAFMLTAQTKLIPMTTLTLSYYDLKSVDGDAGTSLIANEEIGMKAYWADAQIAPKDAPLGLKVALQAGKLAPDSTLGAATFEDTDAFGAKVTAKVAGVALKAIYTSVSDVSTGKHAVSVQNTGTGIKSPLYSQMMYNQNMISLDSDTVVLGAAYNMGDMGTVAANYGMTTMGNRNLAANTAIAGDTDYNELDLVYKVKSGGVQYFAIAAIRDIDTGGTMNTTTSANNTGMTEDTVIRFWARYNF